MTLKIKLNVQTNTIPKDYRRLILHFIKSALEKEDFETFNKYYSVGATVKKPFTFWVSLPQCKFCEKEIILEKNEFTFYISTNETRLAFVFFNAFKNLKTLTIGKENCSTKIAVDLIKDKIVKENEIIINMLSPLVIRNHIKGEKDKYYLFNEDGFQKYFNTIVSENVEITVLKCKKVIVQSYGTNIPSSLGIFKLSGDVKALQKLYLTGLGSKKSAGFGKFDIIG